MGLALVLFAPGLWGEFVFDDFDLVRDNPLIRAEDALSRILGLVDGHVAYRPIRTFSYALDYRIWGLEPAGYHLTNILIHGICGILVYLLAHRLGLGWREAYTATALFVIHPVQVDAVTYISGRRDVLGTMFYLLGVLAFLQLRTTRTRYAPLSVLAFLCSLFTKEMGATMPAVCLFAWIYLDQIEDDPPEKGSVATMIAVLILMFAIALAYVGYATDPGVGVTMRVDFWGGSWGTTLLTSSRVFWFYVGLVLWPDPLTASYSHDVFRVTKSMADPVGWLAVGGWILALVIAWRSRRRFPLGLFALTWFLTTLSTVSHLVVPHSELMAEHYLHLPMIAIAILAGRLVGPWWEPGRDRRMRLLLVGLFMALGMRTAVRTLDWRDPITLWSSTLDAYPDCSRAHTNLALAFEDVGLRDRARSHHERALEIDPDDHRTLNNYGTFLVEEGEAAAALEFLGKAVRLYPQYEEAHNSLGTALRILGNLEGSRKHLEEATRIEPEYVNAWINLGLTLSRLDPPDVERARACHQRALRIAPGHPAAINNLATLESSVGNHARSLELTDAALKAHPDMPLLHLNRARALVGLGRHDEAIRSLKRALTISDHSQLIFAAAGIYLDLGRRDLAIKLHEMGRALGDQSWTLEKLLGETAPTTRSTKPAGSSR